MIRLENIRTLLEGPYMSAKLTFLMDGEFEYDIPIEIEVTNEECIVE